MGVPLDVCSRLLTVFAGWNAPEKTFSVSLRILPTPFPSVIRKSEKLTATIRFGSSRHYVTPSASPKSQTKFIIFKINLPLPARAVVCLIPDATLLRLRIVAMLVSIVGIIIIRGLSSLSYGQFVKTFSFEII